LNSPEKIAELIASPGAGGGGGGTYFNNWYLFLISLIWHHSHLPFSFIGLGGGAAGGGEAAVAEEEEEEKEEEEEAEIGGGLDMFGGEEGGDY
jgi:hypothetical protein